MATTVKQEIQGVRGFLGNPLAQFPTTQDILEELAIEYQHITNRLNNTGNPWLVEDYHLETEIGVSDYRLDIDLQNFYKPLNLYTIPEGTDISYNTNTNKTGLVLDATNAVGDGREYSLEFIELEHISDKDNYLKPYSGWFFNSVFSSQKVAIYKKIDEDGERIYLKLRPTPILAQNYRLVYQVSDWWDTLFEFSNQLEQKLPNSSQRAYVRALVSMNLLEKGVVKWSLNSNENKDRFSRIQTGLTRRIQRYKEDFDEYLTSLDNPDIITLDSQDDSYFI